MIRKLVVILVAVLINGAVLASFSGWSPGALADAVPVQRVHPVQVMPVVTVRPTRAQIEMLREAGAPRGARSTTQPRNPDASAHND